MRVLDIDLDFFLADCCPLAAVGERPVLSGHEPWSGEAVRRFLEDNLGLNKRAPVPGRVFETHDGALKLWDELISSQRLDAPFEVTHIDAHSDLGIGRPGPGFVLRNVLSVKPEDRANLKRYYDCVQLDEANYLLFALAFRWVSRLENVRNPRSRADIPQEIALYDEAGEYTAIKLWSPVSCMFEKNNGMEPEIPFKLFADWREYKNSAPYDFASLAISPRYSPLEADALIGVIAEYFALI